MGQKLLGSVNRRNVIKWSAAGMTVAGFGLLGRPAQAQQKKRIAIGQPDRTAAYYQGFMNAAQKEADKYGYELLQSFSGMDAQKQLAELNTWLAGGVDALIVLALDAKAMGPIVAKTHDEHALFVSYANRIDGEDGYIKWNDIDAGTRLGAYIVKHIKDKLGGAADVGLMTATGIQVVTDRIESTRSAILKELPNTKFYEATATNAPDGLRGTQSMLQAHPELKVIVGCSDDAALGVRSAYQNSGLTPEKVLIAGFDGAKQNLELIKAKDPFLQVSAALDIAAIGRRVIDIPHAIWNGGQDSDIHVQQPYTLVTPETEGSAIDDILAVYG